MSQAHEVVSPDRQREMLRLMQTIRRFEERASTDFLSGDIYGVVHSTSVRRRPQSVCAALSPAKTRS